MIRNFLFHRVSPERDKLWDPMDVPMFDKCIRYISAHYQVVLLEDIVAGKIQQGKKKLATISFDDGYKDNIVYAAPILDKYNCKASFYVVIDCIENNMPTWTHIFEYCFQFTAIKKINIDFDFLPAEYRVTSLDTEESRLAYERKLVPFLKTIPNAQRVAVMQRVVDTCTDITIPPLMMSWDDLKVLKNKGHYIGSHTTTHCMLATVTDEAELQHELLHSAKVIEQKLGHFPVTISYPGGSYNANTIKMSKAAGYTMGLAVKQDMYDPAKDDIFEIPRISLNNEPWWKNVLRITHILEKIKKIIHYR
ncbi:polysaccharide deacetylase family protein [Ferruginibacter profundus]